MFCLVRANELDGPEKLMLNASNNIIELDDSESITISCYAECFPPCKIYWSESNKEIHGGTDLRLENIQKNGNFTCHAKNGINANYSISNTISIILKADTSYCTTVATNTREGTSYDRTTTRSQREDSEDTEPQLISHMMYLVIGMGIVVVAGVSVCLLHKFVKCPNWNRKDESHLSGNFSNGYWTIASNAEGELSTALDTTVSESSEPVPASDVTLAGVNQWEATTQFHRIEAIMELDGYIHAIHSDPVNTDVEPTCQTT